MTYYPLYAAFLSLALCAGMLFMIEAGRRVALFRLARDPQGAKTGFSTIEAAVLALMGLLLAFTVNGANSRFDLRRNQIIHETVAIHTAYIRVDVLPPDLQPAIKETFRRYLDTRIEIYRKLPDIDEARVELAKAAQLQKEIWRQAVDGVRADGVVPQATMVLLPALTAMIDITTERTWTTLLHPPKIIFVMLFTLALASSLLSGYGMAADRSRSWLHMLSLSVIISITVYVVLNLEYPRLGLIPLDEFDQALVELRDVMHEPEP
jgi:hypothetical protein